MEPNSQQQAVLLRETATIADLAGKAISAVVDGQVDPIPAWANIRRMKAAIEIFEKDKQVMDITLSELSKYGSRYRFGDCTLEESEAGVKYDFSGCGDSKLSDMYAMRDALLADIKERESMLKSLPYSGIADPDTGELIYPPARSSKTVIKTTFKKQ